MAHSPRSTLHADLQGRHSQRPWHFPTDLPVVLRGADRPHRLGQFTVRHIRRSNRFVIAIQELWRRQREGDNPLIRICFPQKIFGIYAILSLQINQKFPTLPSRTYLMNQQNTEGEKRKKKKERGKKKKNLYICL